VDKHSFLAKRGVKEEIQTFDARKITPETRKTVEDLLRKNRESFDPKVSIETTKCDIFIHTSCSHVTRSLSFVV